MTLAQVTQQVNALRSKYDVVIAELRAMGMDASFIAEFIDSGQADSIVDAMPKSRKRKA